MALLWAAAWLWLPAAPAGAFTFTPSVELESGYDDNVRLTRNPRSDFFFSVRPRAQVASGPPTRRFKAAAGVSYIKYFRLEDLSQFRSAYGQASYVYEPSQRWRWMVWDRYTATYDPVELDEEGQLVLVREDTGRRDSNTAGLSCRYSYNLKSSLQADYTYTFASYTGESSLDNTSHRASLLWEHRYNQNWNTQVRSHLYHDLYQDSPDLYRVGGGITVFRLLGPTASVFLDLGYQDVRAAEELPPAAQGREYQQYTVTAGFNQEVSPVFGWSASAGYSWVEGDTRGNQAAGQKAPVASFNARYKGPNWRTGVYASSDLGEYDVLNENLGLAYTHRVGAYFAYELSRRTRFTLNATWVRSNYKLAPESRHLLAGRSDEESAVLGFNATHELSRWSTISFSYRHVQRWSEDETDDRTQNRFIIQFTMYHRYQ